MKKILFLTSLLFILSKEANSQNRLDPNCSSISDAEWNQGFEEGRALGRGARARVLANLTNVTSTSSLVSYTNLYSISGSAFVNDDYGFNFEQGGITTNDGGSIANFSWGNIDAVTNALNNNIEVALFDIQSIYQGPYCSIFNQARENGYWAGWSF